MFAQPPDAHSALTPLLEDGEELLWYDQPSPSAVITSQWSSAIVGCAFFAGAMAWTFIAVQESAMFAVVGLGIAGVGLWLASAPVRAPYEAKFVYYAITSRRLIIASLRRKKGMQSFSPDAIEDVDIIERDDRISDVIFRKSTRVVTEQFGDGNSRLSKQIKRDGFFGIKDAEKVAEAIRELKAKAGTPY